MPPRADKQEHAPIARAACMGCARVCESYSTSSVASAGVNCKADDALVAVHFPPKEQGLQQRQGQHVPRADHSFRGDDDGTRITAGPAHAHTPDVRSYAGGMPYVGSVCAMPVAVSQRNAQATGNAGAAAGTTSSQGHQVGVLASSTPARSTGGVTPRLLRPAAKTPQRQDVQAALLPTPPIAEHTSRRGLAGGARAATSSKGGPSQPFIQTPVNAPRGACGENSNGRPLLSMRGVVTRKDDQAIWGPAIHGCASGGLTSATFNICQQQVEREVLSVTNKRSRSTGALRRTASTQEENEEEDGPRRPKRATKLSSRLEPYETQGSALDDGSSMNWSSSLNASSNE
ncbi:hypothetical protein DUNSADRAFT_18388 [Dunaliella salina]|uniref:Encoded protein n=1 Tax=Dunaliella salina TaxID=3046 RepID=A0ABQ7G057_DUNSA|nr:hypothetical protein DUNSADRAFT_18388 [Dunaliella salina]|eukprot:KAF5827991.1 hypothetical protein DUNSADRAFT_18388 [Dunaliella salina]